MQLNAGGHLIGEHLVPPNNADTRLVAGGLDTED
jgi:hypothetical protein